MFLGSYAARSRKNVGINVAYGRSCEDVGERVLAKTGGNII